LLKGTSPTQESHSKEEKGKRRRKGSLPRPRKKVRETVEKKAERMQGGAKTTEKKKISPYRCEKKRRFFALENMNQKREARGQIPEKKVRVAWKKEVSILWEGVTQREGG